MKSLTTLLTVFSFVTVSAIDHPDISAEVLAKSTQSWDGNTLPEYPKGQPEVTVLRVTIPPKTVLKWHKHPVINAGYMVSGNLRVETAENVVLHLTAGDTIVEVIDTWHHGVNEGDEPVEIIVFYAGIKGEPLSITQGD